MGCQDSRPLTTGAGVSIIPQMTARKRDNKVPPTHKPEGSRQGDPADGACQAEHTLADIRGKIKDFPRRPGVYLMKDAQGRVLYVGKAKNLRDRVGSYFQPSADLAQTRGPKIVEMAGKVVEVTYLECENEVDAILQEARLIKDVQPPYNSRQTDDKTFPYLEITTREDFPGVYVTRSPRARGTKLYGPFVSGADLRRVVQVLQRIFQFRTCHLEIKAAATPVVDGS